MHWEEQKWGRAWFEMGLGFRSMADRQSSYRARYRFRVSSECFSSRAKFRPVQRIFHRIKKKTQIPQILTYTKDLS